MLHRWTRLGRYAATSGINVICSSAYDLLEQRSSTSTPASSKVQLCQSSVPCCCFSAERRLAPEQQTLPDPLTPPASPTTKSRRPQKEPRRERRQQRLLFFGVRVLTHRPTLDDPTVRLSPQYYQVEVSLQMRLGLKVNQFVQIQARTERRT